MGEEFCQSQNEAYRVSNLVGTYCVTEKDGTKLLELIKQCLQDSKSIALDFDGVKVFASPFFNSSIGKLLADTSEQELFQTVSILNLSCNGRDVLNRVIENAVQYYSNPKYRAALQRAQQRMSEEG